MLQDMFKDVIQGALNGELDDYLRYSKYDFKNKLTDNSRNGFYDKTINSNIGQLNLNIPRDRKGDFEPTIIKKCQNSIADIEDKIFFMVSKGMSMRDISLQIQDIYGIEMSHESISKITDKILPIDLLQNLK